MADSIYIHIPFCIKKCIYCDFFSVPYDESTAYAYVCALCKELFLKKHLVGKLKSVYIGGGTPSLLPGECFRQIFSCLKDNYELSPGTEVTVEANPGTLSESKIYLLLCLGVNRLSIGVQSFNNEELKVLGRIHTSEEALRSIELIGRAGLRNFSIDLIYGIPAQSFNSWSESLSKAAECSPAHISTYELTPEKGTVLFDLINNPPLHPVSNLKMPPEDSILDMYNYTIDSMANNGYEHYEISNFAKLGFQCIHNLNYWNKGEYIGAGAGAHSFINGLRSRNVEDIHTYINQLSRGVIPEEDKIYLTLQDSLREWIFLGLRKTQGISIKHAQNEGLDILLACREMIDSGHIEVRDDAFRLTRKGVVISNTIIAKLFQNLDL
ncbi:MAG TPA: radical SAM family heme chaperone HemW [Thermodesulfovibrionales bacterium]|nr:radical SAM family heme chaperone HemW [Thermodesulfovibrionales bacterium]